MLRRAPVRFPLLLLALSLLAPVPAAAQSQNNFTYGPLPVFELHSGFWINLHHTLYYEARLRTTAGSQSGFVIERVMRSEEHTSELQSLTNLVCRLLLEKKKKNKTS